MRDRELNSFRVQLFSLSLGMKTFGQSEHKNSWKLKYPRNSKILAIDEETAITRLPMKQPYVKDRVGYRDSPYVDWNHIERWLLSQTGKNIDQVFSEFCTKMSGRSVVLWDTNKELFEDHIYRPENNPSSWDKRARRFTVDAQNRLIQNPNYNNFSWRRRPLPANVSRMAEHNKEVFKCTHAREKLKGVGPVFIGKYYLEDKPSILQNVYAVPKDVYDKGYYERNWERKTIPLIRQLKIKSNYQPVEIPGIGTGCAVEPGLSIRFPQPIGYIFLKDKNL